MTTLSIEHAKHIVRLRYMDAIFYRGVFGCNSVLLNTKERPWFPISDENHKGDADAAWIDAALRILADPEFWIGDGADERVGELYAQVEAEDDVHKATRHLIWAGWRERAEARPSVSGLPDRPVSSIVSGFPERIYYSYEADIYMAAQSSRIVELEKELAETIEDVHAYVFAAKIQRERAELAESKLAVCREETIKECAAASYELGRGDWNMEDDFAQRFAEHLLSKLPSVAAEEGRVKP